VTAAETTAVTTRPRDAQSSQRLSREPSRSTLGSRTSRTAGEFPHLRATTTLAREVFNECISVDYSGLTRIGDAESQDFFAQGGSATQASSAVVIFDDEQQAEDAISSIQRVLEVAPPRIASKM
jgi:hypothetical protein